MSSASTHHGQFLVIRYKARSRGLVCGMYALLEPPAPGLPRDSPPTWTLPQPNPHTAQALPFPPSPSHSEKHSGEHRATAEVLGTNSRSSPTFQICPPKQYQCGVPGLQGLTFHQQDKNYMAFCDSASNVPQHHFHHALLAETLTTTIRGLGWGENAVFSYVLKPPQIFIIRTGKACKRISAGEKYDLICILRSF